MEDIVSLSERFERYKRVSELEMECLLCDLHQREDRIRDLEGERDTYQFWFKKSLHALADVTDDRQKLIEGQRQLRDELRDLRAMVVSEIYDDAVAVMGSETFGDVRRSLLTPQATDSPSGHGGTIQ